MKDFFTANDLTGCELTPEGIAKHFSRLLKERGTVVWGEKIPSSGTTIWCLPGSTHIEAAQVQGLLVCTQPIEKADTAEGLLREIIEINGNWDIETKFNWQKRAKKLLSLHDMYDKDPDGT